MAGGLEERSTDGDFRGVRERHNREAERAIERDSAIDGNYFIGGQSNRSITISTSTIYPRWVLMDD